MPQTRQPADKQQSGRWTLEIAKSRFSEVVRRAQDEGPQHVTVRGRDSVVIMSSDEFQRLTNVGPKIPFVTFMESLDLPDLALERENDRGRDVEL
ncbi:type II toxin-antitoxin system Phd/YefM family antitoxin [Rhizobium sp. LjRoot30]|uniref:type II toxin-antitoxin system Phd/YefM family antitoxin n=1 Tax=Rhizobium sp. LjRoot30 TaxID=3342320 RepID=UPI003ECDA11A